MPRSGLTARRQAFVTEYVYGPHAGNATQSAKAAGFKAKRLEEAGRELLTFPDVKAEVARLTAEKLAAIKARGIADRQNRIDDLQEIRDALKATKAARAADPAIRRAPGGEHGVITIEYKTIPNADPDKPPITVQISKVDTGMISAWLNVLKQAPQDLGQWQAESANLPEGSQVRRIVIEEVQYGGGRAASPPEAVDAGERYVEVQVPRRAVADVEP